jgi:hypothetical protein
MMAQAMAAAVVAVAVAEATATGTTRIRDHITEMEIVTGNYGSLMLAIIL